MAAMRFEQVQRFILAKKNLGVRGTLSDLLHSKTKTKRKQILNNALRFQQQRSTFRG